MSSTSKITIYPEEQIQAVVDFLTAERDIISVSETDGISTVTVQSTLLLQDKDFTYLAAGFYVQINDINYKVLSVIDNVSFNIKATGLESETKWSLALEYRYGSRIEVNMLLDVAIQKDDERLSRFPLLWYIIDGDNQTNQAFDYPVDFETNCKLSLMNLTKVNYTAAQRLDNNFKPTLQPYLDLILKTLNSSYFSKVFYFENNYIDYRKYYRYFYGSATKNAMFTDSPTDAIEFDINLQFQRQYCDENNPIAQGFGLGAMFIIS